MTIDIHTAGKISKCKSMLWVRLNRSAWKLNRPSNRNFADDIPIRPLEKDKSYFPSKEVVPQTPVVDTCPPPRASQGDETKEINEGMESQSLLMSRVIHVSTVERRMLSR